MKKLAIVTAAAALVLGFGTGQALATDRFVDNDGAVTIAPSLDCEGGQTLRERMRRWYLQPSRLRSAPPPR